LTPVHDDPATRVPVVIVGAGPVGLSLAIELGFRSIKCLLIEKNDRVGYAPRAKTTNVRTRTHLRRWGIADKLAQAAPLGIEYPSDILFVTRLAGQLLAKIQNASNCAPERNVLYPEHAQWIPQYVLERILKSHVETLPSVEIRFSTEFNGAEQNSDAVLVRLRDTTRSSHEELHCQYLVGTDGARSAVRELIGAKMAGEYGLSRNYNIVFRAPGLAQAHPHGPGTMYWQVNPQAPSLIGPMDRDDIWFFMPTKLPPGVSLSSEGAAVLIREATGIDLPYEILSTDEWVASRLIADKYSSGRCFLAGDACHLHPPFGGFGMNMGVADAVDLGWKLAARLQGWGGETLLASYEIERRQIHERVMDEAVANHSVLSNDFWCEGLEESSAKGQSLRARAGEQIAAAKVREFHTLGTVLGLCYERSPVILSDGSNNCSTDGRIYTPSSRPGCLAPHAWLSDGTSLYDHFGSGFTLIANQTASQNDVDAARKDALALGMPFTVIERFEGDALDAYSARYTLVRPDQYVGFRGDQLPPGTLRKVTGWA
jgi:2-polyprenyl-6-methoxyphenol hydroxylase-like FAD-dependent oxidoreductase